MVLLVKEGGTARKRGGKLGEAGERAGTGPDPFRRSFPSALATCQSFVNQPNYDDDVLSPLKSRGSGLAIEIRSMLGELQIALPWAWLRVKYLPRNLWKGG
jgi:hypothetical protein